MTIGGMMRLKLGFSLSEIIVTMAVIGIIATLTVPALVQHYQKDIQVTSLKKAYSDLQNNLTNLQTENFRRNLYFSLLGSENTPNVERFFNENYNVNQRCGAVPQPCFAASYMYLDKTVANFAPDAENGYGVLLTNGTALYIIPAGSVEEDTPATVYIDTNGSDNPNIFGRDMFKFYIYRDYTIDVIDLAQTEAGGATEARKTLFNEECTSTNEGLGCFAKILNDNWKMNY